MRGSRTSNSPTPLTGSRIPLIVVPTMPRRVTADSSETHAHCTIYSAGRRFSLHPQVVNPSTSLIEIQARVYGTSGVAGRAGANWITETLRVSRPPTSHLMREKERRRSNCQPSRCLRLFVKAAHENASAHPTFSASICPASENTDVRRVIRLKDLRDGTRGRWGSPFPPRP